MNGLHPKVTTCLIFFIAIGFKVWTWQVPQGLTRWSSHLNRLTWTTARPTVPPGTVSLSTVQLAPIHGDTHLHTGLQTATGRDVSDSARHCQTAQDSARLKGQVATRVTCTPSLDVRNPVRRASPICCQLALATHFSLRVD